jgi:hypothetical protein
MSEYIIHLKSFRVVAKNENDALIVAEKRLTKGFTLPELIIEDIEEAEEIV